MGRGAVLLEAELAAAEGALGASGQVALKARPSKGERPGAGSPEGARNPTCFSAAPPGSLHSTPIPMDRERSITSPCPAAPSLSLAPHPAAHQVKVWKDSGGPVLLGHEQQHLVIDEVAVLLERAPQAQLQGLPDLQAGRRGAGASQVPGVPPFPRGPLRTYSVSSRQRS